MKAFHAALLALTICFIALAQNGTEKPKPEAPKVTVSLTPALIERVTAAQKRTLDAKAALEASVVFKEYQLAFSQEQAQLLYTMGEVGAKPSECTPVFDKDGRLTHLECQPKVDPKAKP